MNSTKRRKDVLVTYGPRRHKPTFGFPTKRDKPVSSATENRSNIDVSIEASFDTIISNK